MATRTPWVAGKFYPKNRYDLADIIKNFQKAEKDKINYKLPVVSIIGGIVPHAGYEFSGYEAIHFFELLRKSGQKFDTVIILTPNHTGYGADISLDTNEFWETPLGKVPLDLEFQERMGFELRSDAHKNEHSAEVIIPFLQQTLNFSFNIVPVVMLDQSVSAARRIAASLFEVSMYQNKKILVIASSDFSHFVSPEEGLRQDDLAVDQILQFNSDELAAVVKNKRISICGCGPIMALLEYSLISSMNPKIELLKRGNSSKRYPSVEVVDYVSFIIFE